MAKKQTNNPVDLEMAAESEAEAMAHYSNEPSKDVSEQALDEEAEKALIAEEASDTDEATPAEVAAIHTDNESALAADDEQPAKGKGKKAAVKETPKAQKSKHSAKYLKSKEHVEVGKQYALDEAVEAVKKSSYTKFDGAVELHLHLNKKKGKGSTESSKGIFHLPHGSGKTKKIIVLTEDKIEEIAKTKKIDFDVAIATPELMPKVARIAKILGPKGKMPDPKSGTVTSDPQKAIDDVNSGRVEYRIDSTDNVHQIVGRVSWDSQKIIENAQTVLSSFPKSKIASAYITASMAPSAQLDLTTLK